MRRASLGESLMHVLCVTPPSFSSLLRIDIPAHFTVTLAGEEWGADGPGAQRLPGTAEEADHPPGPPAPLQRLSGAVSAPRVSDGNGRPEHEGEVG